MPTINNKKVNTLKKLIEAGFDDKNKIVNMKAKEMTPLCKTIKDMTAILELQEALLNGDFVAYLSSKDGVEDAE